MPRYHYDVSISRQKRFIRRFKEFLLICAGILGVVGLIIGIDAIREYTSDRTQDGAPSVSVVRPSIREFDTSYFTFTAPSGWMNFTEETKDNKYVYRSLRGQLVEHELTIYVNAAAEMIVATRVLPVRVDESSGHIIPSEVSEHCSIAAGMTTAKEPIRVTIEQTSFLCQVDGTNFLVAVGEKGSDTRIIMKRGDGSSATFSFLYRSSTTPPDTNQLVDILNSFDAL